jgi:hypothetical protein
MVRIEAVANVIGFLLIALIVMGLAGVAGKILVQGLPPHGIGLPGQAGWGGVRLFSGSAAGDGGDFGDPGLFSQEPTG